VREQLSQRDFASVRRVGQIFRQPVVESELATVPQLQNCGRGELFRDRANFVKRACVRGESALAVAKSVGFTKDDPTVSDDSNYCARCLGAIQYRRDIRIYLSFLIRAERLGDDRNVHLTKQQHGERE
jgi:hypothetical protein